MLVHGCDALDTTNASKHFSFLFFLSKFEERRDRKRNASKHL